MCVGFGQLKLAYNQAFLENDSGQVEGLATLLQTIEKLNPKNLRINLWNSALILPQCNPLRPIISQFGWVEQRKSGGSWPVFNVRVEGGWNNKGNDPDYLGPYAIFDNPYVKELIGSQRCVIPCDFFIEQPSDKKIKKKFLIKKRDDSPIHLAGIYKEQINQDTGEVKSFFTIQTTAFSKITIRAGHQRSPVIIPDEYLFDYLSMNASRQELEAFFPPPDSDGYVAYEVDPIIAKRDCPLEETDVQLIKPIGDLILPE